MFDVVVVVVVIALCSIKFQRRLYIIVHSGTLYLICTGRDHATVQVVFEKNSTVVVPVHIMFFVELMTGHT
jgi:hypothetical protein